LSPVEYFCRSEVLKVFVVGEHLHLVQSTFTVPSPIFECIDDGEKFLIVDIIVGFRGRELS